MKLLIFTDIHGSTLALKRIEQKVKAQNPDLLVCAGDISIFEHGIIGIARRLNKLNKKIIIVTHAPPYKTKLDKLVEGHCGNKSIRHFVERNKIDLLICGHLHENFGKEDKIKRTKCINPGPFGKIVRV